uniref:Small ribosomal subunit protein uS19c n=1 Tax=Taxus sp. 'Emei type' TaxID=2212987 RepID=A0A481XC90_9CONI|nr:ribosomal protein S19 [Taxus sp. 'Emei type']QBK35398.1 ribosomal protein S19 [Taxus sp. 'Emei type']QBK35644.1 ribosomal protein S19 [Taxus sp. 'Emei type']
MARSLRKNTFVANYLSRKIENLNMKKEKKIIVTWSRASDIVPAMIGHTIAVHNGKEHLPIYISHDMINHKLGEFSPTFIFEGHARNDRKARNDKKTKNDQKARNDQKTRNDKKTRNDQKTRNDKKREKR